MDLSPYLTLLTEKLESWLGGLVIVLPNLLAAIVVLFLFVKASRLVDRGVNRLLLRGSGNAPISRLLGSLARVAVIAAGVLVALSLLDLDKTVTSLLAGVGVFGLALGFAFQDIASNFMSGFIMALRHPFEPDDLVETAGQKGIVQSIDLRSTTLKTLQGLSVIVPNREIFQSPIVNYTRTSERRLELTVGVAYNSHLEEVRDVTLAAARGLSGRDESREPAFFYTEFGDSSISFTLHVWLASAEESSFFEARSEAIIAIKRAFDEHKIAIPFPIRTLDFGAAAVGGVRLDAMKRAGAEEPSLAS